MKHNPDTQKIIPSFSFTYLVTKYKNKQIQIGHIHTNTTETWFARPTSSTKKSHNKLNILNPNPPLTTPQPLSQIECNSGEAMEIQPQKVLLIVAAASRAKPRRSMEAERRSEAVGFRLELLVVSSNIF